MRTIHFNKIFVLSSKL